jgi:hypothetical protein
MRLLLTAENSWFPPNLSSSLNAWSKTLSNGKWSLERFNVVLQDGNTESRLASQMPSRLNSLLSLDHTARSSSTELVSAVLNILTYCPVALNSVESHG